MVEKKQLLLDPNKRIGTACRRSHLPGDLINRLAAVVNDDIPDCLYSIVRDGKGDTATGLHDPVSLGCQFGCRRVGNSAIIDMLGESSGTPGWVDGHPPGFRIALEHGGLTG